MVHGLLDAEPMEVLTTAGVCVAGMAAMKHAYNAVRIGEHRAAIATASETASAIMRSEHFRAEIDHKNWTMLALRSVLRKISCVGCSQTVQGRYCLPISRTKKG